MALVLTVENDPDLLEGLRKWVTLVGHEFVGIASVEAALSWMGNYRADLIISDIEFQKQSGIDMLKELRGQNDITPVILVSAGHYLNACAVTELTANAFIPKPLDFQLLATIVAKLLGASMA